MDIISATATLPVFLFGLLGLCVHRGKKTEVLLLLFLIFSFALIYSMFLTHVRYRIPVEPYIILFAGNGMVAVSQLKAHRGVNIKQSE